MPARRRSAQLGTVLVSLLLAAGCGDTQPAALKPMKPDVPANLCATLPEATRAGLLSNSSSDDTGDPTAACSLRSADGASPQVVAVVTWLQTDDEDDADQVLGSQCRSIDQTEYKLQPTFEPAGARKGCAASGRISGADSATLAAASGVEVVTVRLSQKPAGSTPVLARGQQMLEGVISSLAPSS
jgi:hypothetical protein